MFATHEAQVIPVTQTKHFCTLISGELERQLSEAACDPVPLLTPALLGDCEAEGSESPELTGLDFSFSLLGDAGSEEKKEQSQWLHEEKSTMLKLRRTERIVHDAIQQQYKLQRPKSTHL